MDFVKCFFFNLLVWLCDFLLCLMMWWVTLVDFQMLNQPCISGVNPTWSWCIRRRQWQPSPVLLPRKSHGRRSLVGCSPRGRKESDMTERLHFHFSLSCIGEGNDNRLQRSCLENPRDGGAWLAAIYGVAQSQTWLKWLSSSSLIGIALNLQIALGSILIFTILILLIHEHGIFLHLSVSSLISFTSVLMEAT